jgi:hypothetical protein
MEGGVADRPTAGTLCLTESRSLHHLKDAAVPAALG